MIIAVKSAHPCSVNSLPCATINDKVVPVRNQGLHVKTYGRVEEGPIAARILNLGTRWRSHSRPSPFAPEEEPSVPIRLVAWWSPKPDYTLA
jgi:hypothetical protein